MRSTAAIMRLFRLVAKLEVGHSERGEALATLRRLKGQVELEIQDLERSARLERHPPSRIDSMW